MSKERLTSAIGPTNPDFRVNWKRLEKAELCDFAGEPWHLKIGTRQYAAHEGYISSGAKRRIRIFACTSCQRTRFTGSANVQWTEDFVTWIDSNRPNRREKKSRHAKK